MGTKTLESVSVSFGSVLIKKDPQTWGRKPFPALVGNLVSNKKRSPNMGTKTSEDPDFTIRQAVV